METLPKDMMDELVNKLEGKDLIHMCSISNRLRAICDDKFWSMKIKQLLLDEKNVDPEKLKAIFKIDNLKLLYYYLYRRDQLKIPLDTDSKTLEKAKESKENKKENKEKDKSLSTRSFCFRSFKISREITF